MDKKGDGSHGLSVHGLDPRSSARSCALRSRELARWSGIITKQCGIPRNAILAC